MKKLNEYINENLETINEASMNPKKAEQYIKNSYEEDGDATSIGSCFQWLEELGWKKMKDDEMAEEITNINDDIDSDMALERYVPVMQAMLLMGKDKTIKFLKTFIDDDELEDYCGIDD